MIRYIDNPNLALKVVDTFGGGKEYRTNCKNIKGEYYIKDVDCFEVDGRWYRKNSGLIVMDEETKKWVTKAYANNYLLHGVIGFEASGQPILGAFSKNPYNNVRNRFPQYPGIGTVPVLNTDILVEAGYVESVSTGQWYLRAALNSGTLSLLNKITNEIKHNHKGYNIEDNAEEAFEKTKYYEAFPTGLSKDVRRYARFLGDTTFGLEIECSHGYVPEHLQNRTGVVICRDGSLQDENGNYGPEFTTIPLAGAKGLQNIVNISTELKKRTKINEKCSFHIHLGNLPTSRLFLLSLYVLGIKIQDEVFSMFPYYKTDFQTANKEKDYCKKLKPMGMGTLGDVPKGEYDEYVQKNIHKLFYWLSQNQDGSGYVPSKEWNRKMQSHPVVQKWNRRNRYYWVNLMNTMFSSRNTVEFRLHTPTVNSQKMINWLFICNAIVRYAILHPKEILSSTKKISLDEVLDYYKNTFRISQAEFLSNYLKAYVKERKDAFKLDFEKGDYLSQWEIANDKTYEFKFGNVTHLF